MLCATSAGGTMNWMLIASLTLNVLLLIALILLARFANRMIR